MYARIKVAPSSAASSMARLDRGLGLGDRRVEEQAGRAAFERDADALARARMDQQRVEAFGDLRQEVQLVEDVALRPDDEKAALGHAKTPFRIEGDGPNAVVPYHCRSVAADPSTPRVACGWCEALILLRYLFLRIFTHE